MFCNAHIISHINEALTVMDCANELRFKEVNFLHGRAATIIERGQQTSTEEKEKY